MLSVNKWISDRFKEGDYSFEGGHRNNGPKNLEAMFNLTEVIPPKWLRINARENSGALTISYWSEIKAIGIHWRD